MIAKASKQWPVCAACGQALPSASADVPRIEVRCKCGAWYIIAYVAGGGAEVTPTIHAGGRAR